MSLSIRSLVAAVALSCAIGSVLADPVLVGRVTHPITDAQPLGDVRDPALSEDGRYLYFVSAANNLGPPANGALNVYRYDLSGIPHPADSLLLAMSALGTGNSFAPSASYDGERFVFETLAGNLGGIHGNFTDIYFGQSIPLPAGEVGFELTLVTRGLSNTPPNGEARTPSISGSGRYIAYYSDSSNLVAGDNNNEPDIFLADAENLGAPPERVSVDSSEVAFTGRSFFLSNNAVSVDGRFVVFTARAPAGVTTNISDIFLRDRSLGTTTLTSRLNNGTPFNSSSDQAAISSDARFIVFRSFASNGPGSTGSRIWISDRQSNQIVGVPLPPMMASCEEPRVSNNADVIMQCNAAGAGVSPQAYLYRGSSGGIFRLSSTPANSHGNGTSGNYMDLTADGFYITFDSAASDLISGDTNSTTDSFLTIDDVILYHLFGDGFE